MALFAAVGVCLALFGGQPQVPSEYDRIASDLRSQEPARRAAAFAQMRSVEPDPRFLPPLMDALRDRNEHVLLEAIRTWRVRGQMIFNLGYGLQGVRGRLAESFMPGDLYSHYAVCGIEWARRMRALLSSKSSAVNVEALRAICNLAETVEELPPGGYTCGDGLDESLGFHGISELRQFAFERSEDLTRYLADADPQVRLHVALSLRDVRPDAVRRSILRWLESRDNRTRRTALLVCAHSDDPSWFRFLFRLSNDEDPDIRSGVRAAFRNFFSTGLRALQPEWHHLSRELKLLALEIVLDRRDPEFLPVLSLGLADKDPVVKGEASRVWRIWSPSNFIPPTCDD